MVNSKGVPSDWATHDSHELTAMYGIDHAKLAVIVQVYTLSCLKLKKQISTIRKTHFQLERMTKLQRSNQ
jgi:alcohol dehydrogenase YqhD (iron-dependent ADH family)